MRRIQHRLVQFPLTSREERAESIAFEWSLGLVGIVDGAAEQEVMSQVSTVPVRISINVDSSNTLGEKDGDIKHTDKRHSALLAFSGQHTTWSFLDQTDLLLGSSHMSQGPPGSFPLLLPALSWAPRSLHFSVILGLQILPFPSA